MAEEHSLILSVDSRQVKKAEGDLNSLSTASGKTEKSTNGVTTSFFSLGKVLSSIAILGTAQQFIKMADTMTGVESKLKLVTKNTLDLTTAQQSLFEISQKTRQGYAETVDTFSNFALAMGDMGKSQKEILRVTETVNKAIAISGGTAQQAAAATMQLGQAFASGTLRGDELNSILENSKGLAQAIADGMGVPIGKLRTLGSEGKITAEILATALEKSAQSVDDKFGKVGVTVSASLTTVHNALLDMIGTTNSATGATEGLAEMFTYLGTSITDNKADIVEFGKDILRTLQLSGTGVMLMGVEVASFFNNIPYAVTLSIDTLTTKIEEMINDVLAKTEMAVNKVKGLVGGDKVSLGRVDISTNLSKDYSTSAKYLANLSKDLITTSNKLTKDIVGMTTVVSKASLPSDKAGTKKVGATTETAEEKKAREKAEREAKKEAERIAKLNEELADLKVKNNSDAIKQTQADEAKAYQEAILKREQQLEKFKGIKGAELEINKEFNIAVENLNKDLIAKQSQLQISSSAEMYQIMNELSGNWYANEIVNISNRAAAFAVAGQSDIDILNYIASATQAIDAKLAIESIDEMNSSLEDSKDLLSGFNDFGANLDGVAGKIGNVAKTIADMSKNSQKYINKDIELQKKYAKAYLNSAGDVEKEKQAQFELDTDSAKLTEEKLNSEMAGYAALAGTMASAFEQGSAGAIAFTALQSALGIASSWAAIAGAWALPFPANIPAVAAVTAAVMPIIAQLGGSSGGGVAAPMSVGQVGGGEASTPFAGLDKNLTLEGAIKELESTINISNKIAERTGLYGATFGRELKVSQAQLLEDVTSAWLDAFSNATRADIEGQMIGFDLSSLSTIANGVTTQHTDMLSFIDALGNFEDTFNSAFTIGMSSGNAPSIVNFQSASREAINQFSSGLLDLTQELSDHRDDWINIFEDISKNDKFSGAKLVDATQKTDELVSMLGATSFTDALDKLIEVYNIDYSELQQFVQSGDMLGLAQRLKDIFPTDLYNPEKIYDYVEAIMLVGDTMIASLDNIKSFTDSLKTNDQLAQDMADALGVDLATSVDGLSALFNQLAYDTNGLTDADNELLSANKALLESSSSMQVEVDGLNKTIENTTSSISLLDNVMSIITSTVEKLRSASGTTSQSLTQFYDAMAKAQALSTGSDYEAYLKAVKEASDLSSVLLNTNAFSSTADMQFAQLSAANQFELLGESTLTQIDYLKMIEENTRMQIDVLVQAMNSLGTSINSSLLALINSSRPKEKQIVSPTEKWVGGKWTSTSGAVANATGGGDFNISTTSGDTISRADAIGFVNAQLQTGDPMAVYNAALATGISANSLDALMGWTAGTSNDWASAQNLPEFMNGGYTGNISTSAIAGVVHGQENVINAPDSKALGLNGNNWGLFGDMLNQMKIQSDIINSMKDNNDYYLRDIENNTRGSRVVGL